jgi:hypothetical protein
MAGGRLCRRSNAHTHRVEPAAGLLGFRRLGIPLDEAAEFADPGFFLVERDQRLAFAELGGGDFGVAGVLLDSRVVRLDGGFVIALAIGDFSEIKLGVAGEIVLQRCSRAERSDTGRLLEAPAESQAAPQVDLRRIGSGPVALPLRARRRIALVAARPWSGIAPAGPGWPC